MNRARLALVLRWALALVFLAAALPKLRTPHDFAVVVFRYQVLPYALVNLTAIFIPWLEFLSALALLVARRWRAAAFTIIVGLLVVFTALIAFNLYRGIDIACGCFTLKPGAQHMGWWNIARNLGLISVGLAAWVMGRRPAAEGNAAPPAR